MKQKSVARVWDPRDALMNRTQLMSPEINKQGWNTEDERVDNHY